MSEYPKFRAPGLGALPPQKLRTEFREELDQRFVEHETGIQGLQADAGFVVNRMLGCGRALTGDAENDAAFVPRAGNGLTLQLPVGYEAIITGQPFVAADPDDPDSFDIITNVPGDSVVYPHMVLTTEGDLEVFEWSTTPRPDLVALGFPCLGKVTASAGDVTIDLAFETTITPLPLLQAQVAALMAWMLNGGGGGGGEGGGAAAAEQLPFELPGIGKDTRPTTVVVHALFEESKAYTDQQIANGGLPREEQLPTDQLYEYVDGFARNTLDTNPSALRRMPLTANRPGTWGDGSNDGPITDLGGTLPAAPKQREYDPQG